MFVAVRWNIENQTCWFCVHCAYKPRKQAKKRNKTTIDTEKEFKRNLNLLLAKIFLKDKNMYVWLCILGAGEKHHNKDKRTHINIVAKTKANMTQTNNSIKSHILREKYSKSKNSDVFKEKRTMPAAIKVTKKIRWGRKRNRHVKLFLWVFQCISISN